MTPYSRKTRAMTPDGQAVLVATIRHPVATESSVFPLDGAGRVASAMHLYKVKHGPEDDLDAAHTALVAAVEAGAIPLPERDPTPEEIAEAFGDLILLAKMAEVQRETD